MCYSSSTVAPGKILKLSHIQLASEAPPSFKSVSLKAPPHLCSQEGRCLAPHKVDSFHNFLLFCVPLLRSHSLKSVMVWGLTGVGWLILIPLRNPWSWPLLEVLFRIWGTGTSSPPISRFRKSLTQHSVMLLLTRIMTTLEMASWGARKASLCHSQTSRIIDCFLCLESNQHHQATQVYTCLFPL